VRLEEDQFFAGKKLKSEISRSGFSITEKKMRIQYKDSRQDVTGLIVNKKPNVKKGYWRTVKSQCHSLFCFAPSAIGNLVSLITNSSYLVFIQYLTLTQKEL